MTSPLPAWLREIDIALAANPQILITGNLRDVVLLPRDSGKPPRQAGVVDALLEQLQAAGHTRVVVADPVDGIHAAIDDGGIAGVLASVARQRFDAREELVVILTDLLTAVVRSAQPCCLIVAGASRLVPVMDFADPDLHRLLITAEKLMGAAPRRSVPGPHRTHLYNTVFWLLDRESDVPHWLIGSQLARVVSVAKPTLGDRHTLARYLLGWVETNPEDGQSTMVDAARRFAEQTDGLTLRSLGEIHRLLIDRQLPKTDIDDAIRTFRIGVPENPWQSPSLRGRIAGAVEWLSGRVLGQPAAVRKCVDILIRSTMGLTGAQAHRGGARPQGVLFFAGPTGVGKTELAKSIAELVFGTPESFVRFDMSEFTSEHVEARLIGAPPGYTGFSSGGELTNAVRQQPFRLILFDEIEKAHPRILDKFLQILEDGRLTDGTGSTVFFGETLIVFTSNLGVYRIDSHGNRVPVVQPGDYRTVEQKIRTAVAEHFTKVIGRPELLNRIGDNVVVFDFISEATARALVPKFVGNVVARVAEQTGIHVEVRPEVNEQLLAEAVTRLEFGGRAVSNTVESMLVNPLARQLFTQPDGIEKACVTRISATAAGWEVVLE